MYVPTTGRTAFATARNRVGPRPTHSPIVGGGVGARGGPLQRRGASCSCSTPAGRAGTQEQDHSFLKKDRSGPPSLVIEVGPCMQEPSGPGGKTVAYVFVE